MPLYQTNSNCLHNEKNGEKVYPALKICFRTKKQKKTEVFSCFAYDI
jgi:hypothetical protein